MITVTGDLAGGLTLGGSGPDVALTVALAAAGAARAAAAAADVRRASGHWPLWRAGRAAWALVAHDVVVGWVLVGLLAWVPVRVATGSGASPATVGWIAVAGSVAAVAAGGPALGRRRGLPLLPAHRVGRVVGEPVAPLRSRLLAAVERDALRRASRWIAARVERTRRRANLTPEQLLPAAASPARLVVRSAPGVARTETALALLHAQAVLEDAAPPLERLLVLLDLVNARAGRPGVRSVLAQARRTPQRQGRFGRGVRASAAWLPPARAATVVDVTQAEARTSVEARTSAEARTSQEAVTLGEARTPAQASDGGGD